MHSVRGARSVCVSALTATTVLRPLTGLSSANWARCCGSILACAGCAGRAPERLSLLSTGVSRPARTSAAKPPGSATLAASAAARREEGVACDSEDCAEAGEARERDAALRCVTHR